jgi:hypothetical protein
MDTANNNTPILNSTAIVGVVQPSLSTSLATPTGQPQGTIPQLNGSLNQPTTQVAVLQFKELFASAFKTRVDPSPQNVPGTIYHTEIGFYPTLFPNDLGGPAPGEADIGTRLKAVFNNVPQGVTLSVSPTANLLGADGSVSGFVQATTSESGPFAPVTYDPATGLFQVPLVNGSGIATFEVRSTDPAAIQSFNIPLFTSFNNLQNLPPAGATITAKHELCSYRIAKRHRPEHDPKVHRYLPNAASFHHL